MMKPPQAPKAPLSKAGQPRLNTLKRMLSKSPSPVPTAKIKPFGA